jgi:O-acetyl-ADP-ribose deacetylase (regulator of RNase III)
VAHSLRIAKDRELRTLAFPAIGTGIAGFPMEQCAEIMLDEVVKHLQGATSPHTVYFVLFDAAAKGVFEQTWKKLQARLYSEAAGAKGA